MNKHIALFLIAFVGGALLALVVRSARHQPYADPPARNEGTITAPNPAPNSPVRKAEAGSATEPHANHGPAAKAIQTVNTVCPICGMAVDPALQPAEYQGQRVGFGCRACPPKFASDPDRYGPAALRNTIVED